MCKQKENEFMDNLYTKESERLTKLTNAELGDIHLKTTKHLEVENIRINAIKGDIKRANESFELQKEKHEQYMKTEKMRYSALEINLKAEKQRLDYYELRATYMSLKIKNLD